jgi:uncharacterized protein YfaP (DUF2135 family)
MRSCKPLRNHARCILAAAALFVAAAGFSQSMRYPGELGPGDTKLGRYFDTYPFQLTAGDRIVATLRSYDFDAYLHLESPDGTEVENDDYSDDGDARLDVLVDVTGTWKIKVTSYEEGEQGEYLLTVNRERLREIDAQIGVLDSRDPVSVKGEHYDSYTVELQRNQRVILSMQSEEFDAFLVLKPPQGPRMINDDYLEESESRIDFIAEAGGVYEVYATSYAGGEQGKYSLRVLLGEQMNVQEIGGYLDFEDTELEEYGYFEIHPLYIEEGEHLILEMTSEDLDTLLIVEGPDGFYAENDDHNEQTYISRLELFAETEGEYFLTTASYDAGVEGGYTLRIYSFGVSGMLTRSPHQLALLKN